MSYKELQEETNALAAELSSLGIEKGDRVAVSLPNWHETIVVYFAVGKIGAILVPINTQFPIREVQHLLANSGVKALFLSENSPGTADFKQYKELKQELNSLKYLISVRSQTENTVSYNALLERGRNKRSIKNSLRIKPENDIYAIMYTSGTTGKPKGAMLTHRNMIQTATVAGDWMKCRDEDVFLLPIPLFHIMGVHFLFRAVAFKGKLVLMDTFKPEKALSLIEEERVTVHLGVPAMFLLEPESVIRQNG